MQKQLRGETTGTLCGMKFELIDRGMLSFDEAEAAIVTANAVRERAANEKVGRPADAELNAGERSADVPAPKT